MLDLTTEIIKTMSSWRVESDGMARIFLGGRKRETEFMSERKLVARKTGVENHPASNSFSTLLQKIPIPKTTIGVVYIDFSKQNVASKYPPTYEGR